MLSQFALERSLLLGCLFRSPSLSTTAPTEQSWGDRESDLPPRTCQEPANGLA